MGILRPFVAWDLEVARLPRDINNWRADRPLGITCAAAYLHNENETEISTFPSDSSFAQKEWGISAADYFYNYLMSCAKKGYLIVAFNSTSFDWQVLQDAVSEKCKDELAKFALNHSIDILLPMVFEKGYAPGLDAYAEALGVAGKEKEGVSGKDAPRMWTEGKYAEVLSYVKQDAVATGEVWMALVARGYLPCWLTKRGYRSKKGYRYEWSEDRILTPIECKDLPEPEVWGSFKPWPREKYLEW